MPTKVIVYVDGFNLYHAIDDLEKDHLKWVNLWQLSEKLIRPNETLCAVKYFTAYATWRPESYRRHERYVAALETVGVTPVIGHFKAKSVRCQAVCKQNYTTHEEKETDVNIGIHLVADALNNRFDRALVISADTDLNPAVTLTRTEAAGKYVDIVAPPNRMNRNSAALFAITKGKISNSLFPATLNLSNGTVIIRPTKYDPPL
jgi:uncharacterized LabA/DUF88 family protein